MASVKIFFDTEFTDLKKDCDLISIGACAYIDGVLDDGKPDIPCFYAESIDFAEEKCSDFVRDHVLPNLLMVGKCNRPIERTEFADPHGNVSVAMEGTEEDIGEALRKWLCQFRKYLEPDEQIEIWSDCLAYDWVLFCDLMGDCLPKEVCYIPFDLSTLFKINGIDPDISRKQYAKSNSDYRKQIEQMEENSTKHNSLFDAMIIYFCWKIAWEE